MKTKLSFIAILLLMAMLLGSCTNTPDLPENTEPPSSDNSTDPPREHPKIRLNCSVQAEKNGYHMVLLRIAYEDGKQVANLKEKIIKMITN